MKHRPFDSKYRPEFEVVEERRANVTLYPHTAQLPQIHRALNTEFLNALPPRIARADHRAGGFDKLALKSSALIFCNAINAARSDNVRLFRITTKDMVSKVAIVQQMTESHPLGQAHRFRFYAGEEFFPELYLNGKRVVFSTHVLERFSTRVHNRVGEDLSMFLIVFFGSTPISMTVGNGRAFICLCLDSILAFTYRESDTEYFITTCLTVNEINHLKPDDIPQAFNFHYGPEFTKPKLRHWQPSEDVVEMMKLWEKKAQLGPMVKCPPKHKWGYEASWVRDKLRANFHGPGSRMMFLDYVPGPHTWEVWPDDEEQLYDENEQPVFSFNSSQTSPQVREFMDLNPSSTSARTDSRFV
ncbi:MAG: hypothetical protein H0X66_08625 [Verrucomicrobia bacterium]|nr:hypothetical protein [Verrucomicrobiota bacterium]